MCNLCLVLSIDDPAESDSFTKFTVSLILFTAFRLLSLNNNFGNANLEDFWFAQPVLNAIVFCDVFGLEMCEGWISLYCLVSNSESMLQGHSAALNWGLLCSHCFTYACIRFCIGTGYRINAFSMIGPNGLNWILHMLTNQSEILVTINSEASYDVWVCIVHLYIHRSYAAPWKTRYWIKSLDDWNFVAQWPFSWLFCQLNFDLEFGCFFAWIN